MDPRGPQSPQELPRSLQDSFSSIFYRFLDDFGIHFESKNVKKINLKFDINFDTNFYQIFNTFGAKNR